MRKDLEPDFGISIQFERGSESPSRVFRTMTDMIEAFTELDRSLVKSIDVHIETVLLLEDIEAGSLRAWFRHELESIDDDALKTGEWKKIVGQFLPRAKKLLVSWIAGKEEIRGREELTTLSGDLRAIAAETQVRHLPDYAPVPIPRLVEHLRALLDSAAPLHDTDRVLLLTAGGEETEINVACRLAPERIEELLTRDITTSRMDLILKVKKPDYLGESQWEFKHQGRVIPARIDHREWLADFQNRKVDVRPGDGLRADVVYEVRYGFDGEVVGQRWIVERVKEIINYDAVEQIAFHYNDATDE